MIKATELRIGNQVLWKGEIRNIASIQMKFNYYSCSVSDRDGSIKYAQENELEGLPLTVQWMAKLGFRWNAKDKRYYIQIGNTLYLEYDTDFDVFIAPESWAGSCPWNTVKHVHQLQNLYFALTGEELTIKN